MTTEQMALSKITRHRLGDYAQVLRFHFHQGDVVKLMFPNDNRLGDNDTPVPRDSLTLVEKLIVKSFPSLTIATRYNNTMLVGVASDADRIVLEMISERGGVIR